MSCLEAGSEENFTSWAFVDILKTYKNNLQKLSAV
jgi:hypothetical protein